MTDPARSLDQAERDRLATYVNQSWTSSPWWYYAGLALAGGTAVSAGDIDSPWVAIPLALVAASAIGALEGGLIRRAGMIPRLREMPGALRNVLATYWAVAGATIGAALIWAFSAEGDWAFTRAGVLLAVVVGTGGPIADRVYRRRADRLAEEAGISRG